MKNNYEQHTDTNRKDSTVNLTEHIKKSRELLKIWVNDCRAKSIGLQKYSLETKLLYANNLKNPSIESIYVSKILSMALFELRSVTSENICMWVTVQRAIEKLLQLFNTITKKEHCDSKLLSLIDAQHEKAKAGRKKIMKTSSKVNNVISLVRDNTCNFNVSEYPLNTIISASKLMTASKYFRSIKHWELRELAITLKSWNQIEVEYFHMNSSLVQLTGDTFIIKNQLLNLIIYYTDKANFDSIEIQYLKTRIRAMIKDSTQLHHKFIKTINQVEKKNYLKHGTLFYFLLNVYQHRVLFSSTRVTVQQS